MRPSGGRLAVLLTLALMLAVPFAAATASAAPGGDTPVEPAEREVTAYGYIANLSDQEENTPLQDVQVTLYDSDKNIVEPSAGTNPVKTDSAGRFEFTFLHADGDTYYLTFEYPGYMVRSLPDSMDMDDDGFVSFDPAQSAVDDEGRYAMSGEAGGLHAIVMAVTTGIIYGTIQGFSDGETFSLSGATITVVSEDGVSQTTKSGSNGYFVFEDCPFGTYTLTVSCRGFQSSEPITVESGSGTAYGVTLVQNNPSFLFGMDIAHSMMVVGLVMLALILVIVTWAHARSKGGDSEPILMNDLDEIAQQDGDELRRP